MTHLAHLITTALPDLIHNLNPTASAWLLGIFLPTADAAISWSWKLFTVLVVLREYLVTDPTKTPSIPTLFFWHDTDRRRTFYLFAYMDHPMEARTYSAAELLDLRRSDGCDALREVKEKLEADPEYNEVAPKDKGNITQAQTRASKKSKVICSSSNESDEIVYQSKNPNRQSNQPTQHGSDVQWKYRGRTGSEVTSSDPIPAPTGLDKQSSEGFQRFFKAVVSPTHVRVTAGGRIVPNTRNSVSPTTKWDQERAPTDSQNPVESTKGAKAEPIFAPANSHLLAPIVTQAYQNQPVVYHHMGVQIPVYHPMQPPMQPPMHPPMQPAMQPPMQHGFGYPYAYAPITAPVPNASYLPFPENEQRAQVAAGGGGRQNGGENDNKPQRGPIAISPAVQFDQSRPFFFNGQMVFPSAGMGSGPMPHMAPNHYFQHSAMPAAPQHDPRMAAMNHLSPSMSMAMGPNALPPQLYPTASERIPATQQAPTQAATPAGPSPGGAPPVSSIRPSEITRKQLEGLRTSLKYYIGQLQFNRHQIDEPWVYAQAQRVRQSIKQFEHNFQLQLRFEIENYPNMEPTPRHISEMTMPAITPSRPPSNRQSHASGSSQHDSIRSINQQHPGSRNFQPPQQGVTANRVCPRPNRAAVGINSNRTDNSTAHIDALEAAVIQRLSAPGATPEQKLMLEAITRPLNPQHDVKIQAGQQSSSGNSSSKNSFVHLTHPGETKQQQGQTQLTGAYVQNHPGNGEAVQHEGAYLANGIAPPVAPASGNRLCVPYLVGNYPPGTDPWTYQGHEFVYARELTDAEKQARNAYWGKLSVAGTGLPKFDGKDFYPASPQKAVDSKSSIRNGTQGQPEPDFGAELRRSEIDPFRSSRGASSIRSYESTRKFSKAIPIVAPPDAQKKDVVKKPTKSEAKANENGKEQEKLAQSFEACKLSSSGDNSTRNSEKKKSPSLSRRALERSSVKSGHDLWQSMLKKGSTSGNVVPGTVSSTNATGYLPQYAGNAIASLGPTISNVSPARASPNADDKFIELEGPHAAMGKVGENCPPSSAPSLENDATKELHQHMFRDAERRGVIGSDWQ
ncbi:hypothetical protein SAMD00023353_3400670 [Rosellinia necatrix]|uniref:Uncharacterized protein n=1 Tax=Rosellinia necatrix TaxID=77044 RepID=A0A1W2TL10_ROSNE|nr:hypothetical protein SAMD00023353_3400670 [Rosellinia necatrix]